MNDIDWMLLEELQTNARASYRDLGEKVGLTAPAVAERMRKLERCGVIEGYSARVDLGRVGFPILAIIRIRSRGDEVAAIDELAVATPEVLECHRVTGSESHVLRAMVRSTTHLEELLDRFRPYGETITNIVTSSSVRRRIVTGQIARDDEPT